MTNYINTTAYLNWRHTEEIELTAQIGRTYTKRVRRGHGESKRTKLIEKQVYADKRGWLYIINEDEHGIRTAEKVSYRDCHYGKEC